MDKYTPDELKDLPNMKRRVMQNVVEHVTSKQKKRSLNLKFTVLAAAFTLGICLFVGYEVFINKDTQSPKVVNHEINNIDQDPSDKTIANFVNDELAVEYWKQGTTANTEIDHNTKGNPDNNDKDTDNLVNPDDTDNNDGEDSNEIAPRDFTRPNITVSNNKFYIEGVSLGDTVEKVTSILGPNYTSTTEVDNVDGGDLQIVFNNIANFYFYENKLFEIMIVDLNQAHYDKFYSASQLIKIEDESMNLLYIKNTNDLIKTQMSGNKLILYLRYADPVFYYYYPEYKH